MSDFRNIKTPLIFFKIVNASIAKSLLMNKQEVKKCNLFYTIILMPYDSIHNMYVSRISSIFVCITIMPNRKRQTPPSSIFGHKRTATYDKYIPMHSKEKTTPLMVSSKPSEFLYFLKFPFCSKSTRAHSFEEEPWCVTKVVQKSICNPKLHIPSTIKTECILCQLQLIVAV